MRHGTLRAHGGCPNERLQQSCRIGRLQHRAPCLFDTVGGHEGGWRAPGLRRRCCPCSGNRSGRQRLGGGPAADLHGGRMAGHSAGRKLTRRRVVTMGRLAGACLGHTAGTQSRPCPCHHQPPLPSTARLANRPPVPGTALRCRASKSSARHTWPVSRPVHWPEGQELQRVDPGSAANDCTWEAGCTMWQRGWARCGAAQQETLSGLSDVHSNANSSLQGAAGAGGGRHPRLLLG